MTMTTREAFEHGTDTFNAHDMDGFAEVVADDVVVVAPGMRGEGKPAFVEFYGGWLQTFPDAHIEVHDVDFSMTSQSRRAHSADPRWRPPHPDGRRPTNRSRGQPGLHPRRALPRRPARLVQPDLRPAADARELGLMPASRRRREARTEGGFMTSIGDNTPLQPGAGLLIDLGLGYRRRAQSPRPPAVRTRRGRHSLP